MPCALILHPFQWLMPLGTFKHDATQIILVSRALDFLNNFECIFSHFHLCSISAEQMKNVHFEKWCTDVPIQVNVSARHLDKVDSVLDLAHESTCIDHRGYPWNFKIQVSQHLSHRQVYIYQFLDVHVHRVSNTIYTVLPEMFAM